MSQDEQHSPVPVHRPLSRDLVPAAKDVEWERKQELARQHLERTRGVPTFARPDWVMLGMPYAGGVVVIASIDMDEAELKAEFANITPDLFVGDVLRRFPDVTTTLTASMRQFTQVLADDYGQAIQSLFELWKPRARNRNPAIER